MSSNYQAVFKIPCQIEVSISDIEADSLEHGLATAHDRVHEISTVLGSILKSSKTTASFSLHQLDTEEAELLNFCRIIDTVKTEKIVSHKLRLYFGSKKEVQENWETFCKEIGCFSLEEAESLLESAVTSTSVYSAGVIYEGPFEPKGFKVFNKYSDRGRWEIEAYGFNEQVLLFRDSWISDKKEAVKRGLELICDGSQEIRMIKIIDFSDRSKGPCLCRVIR